MITVNKQETRILTAVEVWSNEGYKVRGVDTNGATHDLNPNGMEEGQAIEIVDAVRELINGEPKLLADVEDLVADMVGSMMFNLD
jgi:hypothetical protein